MTFINNFEERSFEFEITHANADTNIDQIENYKHYKKYFEILAYVWKRNLVLVNKWKPIFFSISHIYPFFILSFKFKRSQTSFSCPTVWIFIFIFYNEPISKWANQETKKSDRNSQIVQKYLWANKFLQLSFF